MYGLLCKLGLIRHDEIIVSKTSYYWRGNKYVFICRRCGAQREASLEELRKAGIF